MKRKGLHNFSHGQSMAEYAILLAIVSASLIGMQTYMKRGIQGVIRAAADDVGKQEDSYDKPGTDANTHTLVPFTSSGTKDEKQIESIDGSQRSEINEVQSSSGETESSQWEDE